MSAEAARRRQACLRQRRQIGGLGADLFGVGRKRIAEREDEGGHARLVLQCHSVSALPLPIGERVGVRGPAVSISVTPYPDSLRGPDLSPIGEAAMPLRRQCRSYFT